MYLHLYNTDWTDKKQINEMISNFYKEWGEFKKYILFNLNKTMYNLATDIYRYCVDEFYNSYTPHNPKYQRNGNLRLAEQSIKFDPVNCKISLPSENIWNVSSGNVDVGEWDLTGFKEYVNPFHKADKEYTKNIGADINYVFGCFMMGYRGCRTGAKNSGINGGYGIMFSRKVSYNYSRSVKFVSNGNSPEEIWEDFLDQYSKIRDNVFDEIINTEILNTNKYIILKQMLEG